MTFVCPVYLVSTVEVELVIWWSFATLSLFVPHDSVGLSGDEVCSSRVSFVLFGVLLLQNLSMDVVWLEGFGSGGDKEVFLNIFIGIGESEEDKSGKLPVFIFEIVQSAART